MISPPQPLSTAPGKVEVLEVFWLACPHCYAFEPYLRKWRKSKPSYVDFVRVPVMWQPLQRAHARFYYTLKALGGHRLVETAFTALHQLEEHTGTEEVLFGESKQATFQSQQRWAEQHGVSAADFSRTYHSFYVNTQLQQASEITQAYEVEGVPFIAVDGRYATNVEKAGGPGKLISLINFLSAWDHDHERHGGSPP